MTQEEKSLLLQDLCVRLPYNLYVRVEEFNAPKNEAITEGFIGNYLKDNRCNDYDADGILNELADDCINVKPYLRPMSSMTDDEWREYKQAMYKSSFSFTEEDWFNSHYFDHRGLIDKGLALEAPEGMYKTE